MLKSINALGNRLAVCRTEQNITKRGNMDSRSEQTVDIESSISKAYDASLPIGEQRAIRAHLAYILPKIKEPHAQLEPIKAALVTMDQRARGAVPWFQRPVGVVTLAVIAALIVIKLTKLFG